MANNYGSGGFFDNFKPRITEAYFVDKTGKLNAQKYMGLSRMPARYPQQNIQQQAKPSDEALMEDTEGKPENTPVAPQVEVTVHAYGESQSNTAQQQIHEILEDLVVVDQDDLIRGLIMSEVLGKPKAFRRRGRW